MKSYLKFLSRNKLYTAIEAVGLAVSLAFLLIIGSSIRDQRAIVKGVSDHENLYLVGPPERQWMGQYRLTGELSSLPQVKRTGVLSIISMPLSIHGMRYSVKVAVMDETMLEMIPLKGSDGRNITFSGTEDVLITESAARRIFPGQDPLGQTIGYPRTANSGPTEKEICGIISGVDYSAYADFDILVNLDSQSNPFARQIREADYNKNRLYAPILIIAQVIPGADLDQLEGQVRNLPGWIRNPDQLGDVRMVTPYDDLYYSLTNIQELRQGKALYLYVQIALGVLLFLLALLSFVNLSLAASGRRAKEMVSRRLLGESRGAVFTRVLLETVGFTLVCFLLAIPLAHAMVPGLDRLRPSGLNVPFRICSEASFWSLAVAGVVLSALLAGIAPAALCASFRPLDVVSGRVRRRQKLTFNRICIIFQSALALVLVTMTVTLHRQLRFMEKSDIGVDLAEDLYYLDLGPYDSIMPLSDALRESPLVRKIGTTIGYPTKVKESLYVPKEIFEYRILCDSTAFELLGFRLEERFGQLKGTTLLTRSAANEAGISQENTNPEYFFDTSVDNTIIGGIVGDFRITPVNGQLKRSGPAMVVVFRDEEDVNSRPDGAFLIQTTDDHREFEAWLNSTVDALARESQMSFAGFSEIKEEAGYLKDLIVAEYDDLRQYTRLVEIFCLVSILLSMLALVAMSSFYAATQSKGIAIRKVFGGTIGSETWRGIGSYMLWIGIAVALAVPVGVVLARRFLEDYPERISGYWWIFVAAVLMVLLVSFASVLWQTLRAARTNPAVELKKE